MVGLRILQFSVRYTRDFLSPLAYEGLQVSADLCFHIVFCVILFGWGMSLSRIGNSKARRILFTNVMLLVLLFSLRVIRFSIYLPDEDTLSVYLWYGYYFAMIIIPTLNLIFAIILGNDEKQSTLRISVPLFSVGTALFILVITNSFHQLVFRFAGTPIADYVNDYEYRPVYYIIAAFILVCEISFILIIMYKAATVGKRTILPFVVLFAAILYAVGYSAFDYAVPYKIIDFSFGFCIFHILLWESIFSTNIIPSNRDYVKMFSISGIYARIFDKEGNLIYKTFSDLPEDSGEFLEKSAPVRGGSVHYYYDNHELNSLIGQLSGIRQELSEDVNILDEEVKVNKKKERIRIQDELYNSINKKNEMANRRIRECLDREDLLKILIWGVYIKRYTNLYLLKENGQGPLLSDLSISIGEVMDYLRLNNIECSYDIIEAELWESAGGDDILSVFSDFYEHIAGYDNLLAISLILSGKEGKRVLRINAEGV